MQPASLLSSLVGLYSTAFCIYWAATVLLANTFQIREDTGWCLEKGKLTGCVELTLGMFVCTVLSVSESFVESICILGSRSRLCILQQAGFLEELLYAKFMTVHNSPLRY